MLGFLKLKILYKSFFDRQLYIESIVKEKGLLLLYIFLLVFITASPALFSFSSGFYGTFNSEILPAFKEIPDITVAGGQLSYNGPETLTIKIPKEDKDLAVFHSGNEITDIDQVNAYVLVLKDKFVYTYEGKRQEAILSAYEGSVKIPQGSFAVLAMFVGFVVFLLVCAIIFVWFFVCRLLAIFVFACLLCFVAKDKDELSLEMQQCFRISTVATTPPALFLAFCTMLFPISMTIRIFMTLFMGGAYLIYGVKAYISWLRQEKEVGSNSESIIDETNIKSADKEQHDN